MARAPTVFWWAHILATQRHHFGFTWTIILPTNQAFSQLPLPFIIPLLKLREFGVVGSFEQNKLKREYGKVRNIRDCQVIQKWSLIPGKSGGAPNEECIGCDGSIITTLSDYQEHTHSTLIVQCLLISAFDFACILRRES
ncbi:uncharacterized protein G2W53_020077 [Senna tora]|uniref:Uncharacterized protein n=1 Tax=Senna tora TaxID=362788 RepID=A0A834TUS0_9FABA|nr:uncharacterized protein G2W53_020077 [Senna tora]